MVSRKMPLDFIPASLSVLMVILPAYGKPLPVVRLRVIVAKAKILLDATPRLE
jgi:hypothetical protein